MMAREPYPAVPCVQVNEWALHGPFFRPPSAISRQKTGSFPAEVRYLGFKMNNYKGTGKSKTWTFELRGDGAGKLEADDSTKALWGKPVVRKGLWAALGCVGVGLAMRSLLRGLGVRIARSK